MQRILIALFLGLLVAPVFAQSTPPQIFLDFPNYTPGTWSHQLVIANASAVDASGKSLDPQQFVWLSDGANQSHTFVFIDSAGNCAQAVIGPGPVYDNCAATSYPGVNIDRTPPVVTITRSRTPNDLGWNNTPVTLHFSGTALSGINDKLSQFTGPLDFEVASQGKDQVFTRCIWSTVGFETCASATLSLDLLPPHFTVTRTPAPDPRKGGWDNRDVRLQVTADALSGIVNTLGSALPFDQTFSSDQITPFNFGAVSGAGTLGLDSEVVKIDKTPPVITYQLLPGANAAGWSNKDTIVRFTAIDNLSGVLCLTGVCAGSSIDIPITREGQNIPVSSPGFVDAAGNSAQLLPSPTVNIDKTPPVVTVTQSPAANASGWNTTDVNVHFAVSDNLSGLVEGPLDFALTAEGRNFAQHRYFDVAGNFVDTTYQVNIEKSGPRLQSKIANPLFPNRNGWYNRPVDVTFTATATSGFAGGGFSASATEHIDGEGTGLRAAHTFTSVAGNSATFEHFVNIDKTPPVITATQIPAANKYGWNNTDVTAMFTATDALSGMAGDNTKTVLVTTEGKNQNVFAQFADLADNNAFSSIAVSIDKTPPNIVCMATPSMLWPPNHQLVPVSVGITFDDGDDYAPAVSGGPANGYTLVSLVRSDPKSGDVVGFNVGSQSTSGQLLAWRAAQLPVYTFTYSAMDFAGNVGTCNTQVTVGR